MLSSVSAEMRIEVSPLVTNIIIIIIIATTTITTIVLIIIMMRIQVTSPMSPIKEPMGSQFKLQVII